MLGAGVSGHAVNWHWTFDGCLRSAIIRVLIGPRSSAQNMSKIKPAPLPDTTIGGYRVIRRLSSGGFGVVYLAVDADGQQIAIKDTTIVAGDTHRASCCPRCPEKLSLLTAWASRASLKKAALWPRSRHASVVSVLNFFRENETVYMVMNYLGAPPFAGFHRHRARPQAATRCSASPPSAASSTNSCAACLHRAPAQDAAPGHQTGQHLHHRRQAVVDGWRRARSTLSGGASPSIYAGFAAPGNRYRRDSAIIAQLLLYCMCVGPRLHLLHRNQRGAAAPEEKDRRNALALAKLREVAYSDSLIEVVEWCMALDPLSRPQSVFALQRNSREGERRYTKLSVARRCACSSIPWCPTPRRMCKSG